MPDLDRPEQECYTASADTFDSYESTFSSVMEFELSAEQSCSSVKGGDPLLHFVDTVHRRNMRVAADPVYPTGFMQGKQRFWQLWRSPVKICSMNPSFLHQQVHVVYPQPSQLFIRPVEVEQQSSKRYENTTFPRTQY